MKKVAILLLLVLLLCSCQRIEVDITSQPSSGDEPLSAPSGEILTSTDAVFNPIPVGALRYLGAQNSAVITPNGIYEKIFQNDGHVLIVFADFTQKEQAIICDKPGCTHQDESCVAFIGSPADPIAYVDGTLLYAATSMKESGSVDTIQIWKLDLDSQEKSLLCTLPSSITSAEFLCTDDKTLFIIASTTLRQVPGDEPGITGESTTIADLLGIDIASGKIVSQIECGERTFFNVLDKRILYSLLTPADGMQHPFTLGAWSPLTGEDEILIDETNMENSTNLFGSSYADGYFYGPVGAMVYGEVSKDIQLGRTDVLTANTTVIPVDPKFPEYAGIGFAGDAWFIGGWIVGFLSDNVNPQKQIWINPETGEVRTPTLTANILGSSKQVEIFASYNEFYIAVTALEEYTYTYHDPVSGEDIPQNGYLRSYSLINKDDFWAGNARYIPITVAADLV